MSANISLDRLWPDRRDGYTLVALLLRLLRERAGVTQAQLAAKAALSQGTISNVGRMPQHVDQPAYIPSRESILKILTWGLGASIETCTAVLVLFDGDELTADEMRRYQLVGDPEGQSFDHFLHLLDMLSGGVHRQKEAAQIHYTDTPALRDLFERQLLELESNPGQRLAVGVLPSELTLPVPECAPRRTKLVEPGNHLALERRKRFRENLLTYGQRSIHCAGCVRQYLDPDPRDNKIVGGFPWAFRKAHLASWRDLLVNNDKYQVALTDERFAWEFALTVNDVVFEFGMHLGHGPGEVPSAEDLGAFRFVSVDPRTILAFVLIFERQWQRLVKAGSAYKQDIITEIDRVLSKHK